MGKKNNFWYAFGLNSIEVVLVILLLLSVRDYTKATIVNLQHAAPDLAKLQNELATENLTTYNYGAASTKIDAVDKAVTKGMFVAKIVLPIGLCIVLSLSSFLVWKLITHVRLFYFFKYFSVLFLIAYFFISNFFSFLSYFLVGDGDFSLFFFVSLGIFLIIWAYIYLVSVIHQKTFIQNLKFGWKHLRSLVGWFVVFIIINKAITLLVMLIFIFLWAGSSIIIASMLLIVCLGCVSWVRQRFVKKMNSF